MRPKQLQTFLAVLEQGSIRSAARSLGVTQPAVTRTVRELERDLGAPLVERTVKGISLTDFGQAFAPRAVFLIEEMQRARDEVRQMFENVGGQVSIGVTTSIALGVLPQAFNALRQHLPTVRVKLSEGPLPSLLSTLRNGTLDFAVAHVGARELDPKLEFIKLGEVGIVVGARQGHPLMESRSLHDLQHAEWLLPNTFESLDEFNAVFNLVGIQPPKRMLHGQSVTVALALGGQSDLLSFFVQPLLASSFRHHGLNVIPIEEPMPKFQLCIIRRRGHRLTPVAQQFLECFRATRIALL